MLLAVPALRALRESPAGDHVLLAGQPRLGALLAALGVVDAWRDFEALGLGPLFVDGAPRPAIEAIAQAGRVVCWFGARDHTFVRRLGEIAPGAVVASSRGDGTIPVWRHLLASVGAGAGTRGHPVRVPEAAVVEGQRVLAAAGWDGRAPLVVVQVGAGGLAKRWPAEGFARVLTGLARRGIAVAVHEGPADRGTADALSARLDGPLSVLREPPLLQLAGALRSAAAWLGNDSGVSHLAAAVGVPALVLFEPMKLAWQPWSATARAQVVQVAAATDDDVRTVRAGLDALLG